MPALWIRIHPPEAVHLRSNVACLLKVGQVPDHCFRTAVNELAHGREALHAAHVHDDLLGVVEQRARSGPS
jgi:hypothetical protein